jgi:hypothetical protein
VTQCSPKYAFAAESGQESLSQSIKRMSAIMDIVIIAVLEIICAFVFLHGLLRCIKFYMDGEKASENKEFRKMYIMTAVCLVIMLAPSILAGFVR